MKYFILILSLMSIIPLRVESSTIVESSKIQWQACSAAGFRHWFRDPPAPMLQCGNLDVPLRYKNGTSLDKTGSESEVTLALTRLPAKGVSKGSLLVISGGPGISGIDSPLDTEGSARKIHEAWDIVTYDPRGVGRSRPAIDCSIADEKSDPDNYIKILMNACVKNTRVHIMKHMGSDEAVSDVERIRKAIGDKKLTALAYSYGTQVALLYAERFPSAVQAMVLDGIVDIEEARDNFIMRLNQEKGYQATFERFAAWCAETKKCPLSANGVISTQQYIRLLDKLYSDPLNGPDGLQASAQDLVSLTTSLLLWKSDWPDLAEAVKQLSRGSINEEFGDILNKHKIGNNLSRRKFGSFLENSEDALNVITCVDFSPSGLSRDEISHRRKKIKEAFPAVNFQPQQPDAPELCDLWPWRSNFHTRRPARTPALPQLLFVAQRHDPSTPWQNARTMATQFNGTLITVEGDGHTLALSGINKCADKAIIRYLNTPTLKQSDSICRSEPS